MHPFPEHAREQRRHPYRNLNASVPDQIGTTPIEPHRGQIPTNGALDSCTARLIEIRDVHWSSFLNDFKEN